VNGSRGVIINVTGGPDLSLVEVSEASLIVQEAADEDANIIFGAVVDPTLKGKVKITVIATGFGPQTAARPATSAAQTPVDMTPYADHARARADVPTPAAAALDRLASPRLSIARRPLIELPLAMSAGVALSAPAAAQPATAADAPSSDLPLSADASTSEENPDFDLGSTFDVPAFLRRQEG
jgi:cell division protein FtsZ